MSKSRIVNKKNNNVFNIGKVDGDIIVQPLKTQSPDKLASYYFDEGIKIPVTKDMTNLIANISGIVTIISFIITLFTYSKFEIYFNYNIFSFISLGISIFVFSKTWQLKSNGITSIGRNGKVLRFDDNSNLSLSRIKGKCPKCNSALKLSVINFGDGNKKHYGICFENEFDHIFKFNKQEMSGTEVEEQEKLIINSVLHNKSNDKNNV